jgi:hypothetical protein
MNNRPISDRKVNFKQAKIIETNTNEQKRVKSCIDNIDRILKQHDCKMLPMFEIVGNQFNSRVVIMANKREP